jgi:prevent-host-death family protein
MKRTSRPYPAAPRAKRLNVSEAKAKLSQALRQLEDGPTVIHNRGRDVAALISIDDYERLLRADGSDGAGMRSFLESVEALKRDLGGGAELPVERARIHARDPFGRGRR